MPNLRQLLLLVLLVALPQASLAQRPPKPEKPLFVIAVHEWKPFASPQSKYMGLAPRITSEVLLRLDYKLQYRFVHWTEALDGLTDGKYDAALVWVMDDLEQNDYLMSDPLYTTETALYYNRDIPEPQSSSDLKDLRMGVNPGYVYGQESFYLFMNKIVKPVKNSSDLENFRMLVNGDIDVYLTPLITGRELVNNQFSRAERNRLGYTTRLFRFPDARLLVSKDELSSESFLRLFNAGLQRLKTNGLIENYLDDYRYSKY